MKRAALGVLAGWLAVTMAGAQAGAPPADPGSGAPTEEGAPSSEALGGQQATKRVRQILALPAINEGPADQGFWSIALTRLLVGDVKQTLNCSAVHDADLLEAFQTGRASARNEADRRRALELEGGDTVLVTWYTAAADGFKIRGEAFDAGDLGGKAVATAEVSAKGPYNASQRYYAALSATLGAAVQSAPAAGGSEGAPAEGAPAMGEPGSEAAPPAEGAPAMADPGSGVEGGATPAPAPEPEVPELKIESWARGLQLWPFSRPKDVYRGDIENAALLFEKQLTEEPTFNLGYPAAAVATIALGDEDRGVLIQKAWVDAQGRNAIELHNLAVVQYAAGRPDEVVATLREALVATGGPLVIDALFVGQILLESGRLDEAVPALKDFTAQYPAYRAGYLTLAEAVAQAGQPREAVQPLQTAIAMAPGAPDAYLALVDTYLQVGLRREAITVAKRATEVAPRDPTVWTKLVEARLSRGDVSGATQAAQRAVEVGPQRADAHQSLGEVRLLAGQYPEAAASFEQASRLDPKWNRPRRYLARTRLQANDIDGAAQLIEQALGQAADEDMPETCRDAARTAFYRGEFEQASQYLRVANDYRPKDPNTLMVRSFVRLYLGDDAGAWEDFAGGLDGCDKSTLDEAFRVFSTALRQTQPLVVAHVCLGVIYERAEQLDKARAQYRNYLAKQAKGFLADYAKERLAATERRPGR